MGEKFSASLISICSLLFCGVSSAGNVTLSPVGDVTIGTSFTVDLSISAFDPATRGGEVNISWDSGVISYVGYTVNAPWSDEGYDVDFSDPATGYIDALWFDAAAIDAQTDALVLSLTFSADSLGSTDIRINDKGIFDSSFIKVDGTSFARTDLTFYDTSVNVTAVPVPAAVWLFGSGLLGLAGVARRKVV